jgi:hypothetical protein
MLGNGLWWAEISTEQTCALPDGASGVILDAASQGQRYVPPKFIC